MKLWVKFKTAKKNIVRKLAETNGFFLIHSKKTSDGYVYSFREMFSPNYSVLKSELQAIGAVAISW